MNDISIPNTHFLGQWIMLILTGIYLSFLPELVLILRRRRKDGALSIWLPAASVMFFIVFFLHLGIELRRSWLAFSVREAKHSGNPVAFYSVVTTPESLIKNALTPIVAILSDAIIVYRTYVLWRPQVWVAILPLGLLLSGTAIGIWAIWTLAQTTTGDVLIQAEVTQRIRIFLVLTFALNLLCSGLISFRLWRVASRVPSKGSWQPLSTSKVLAIVTESATIYCAHLLILIVTAYTHTNVFFVFLDPLPQVTVIVFSLLILRVANESKKDRMMSSVQFPSISFTHTHQETQFGAESDIERAPHASEETCVSTLAPSVQGRNARRTVDSVIYEKDDKSEVGMAM